MTDTMLDSNIIVNIKDDFDLERIAHSGQCFRWNITSDGSYRIIHAGKCLYIKQTGDSEFLFECGEDDFNSIWKSYFDLDEDYAGIRERIDARKDPFLYQAAQEQKGIRILRQDPWETLVSFIISQNKNIPAIRKSIELLSQTAGEKMMDARGNFYYTFPAPEEIFLLTESDLKACKVGYRWKYIKAAAASMLDGSLDLLALLDADEQNTITKLTGVYGVGIKVANCVSLYGLHHTDAFPIDVWMKRILANEYPGGYPYEQYSPYNGIYQQYMFASYRNRYS